VYSISGIRYLTVLVNVIFVMMVYTISYREMLPSKQTGHIVFCTL